MAVSKGNRKTGKTAVVPQRVVNKVSPWIMPQMQVATKDFTGWRGTTTLTNTENNVSTTITVTSFVELSAKHGRMFYLANRIAQGNKNRQGTIHVDEILKEMGIKSRPENRKKVVKLLRECVGMTIGIDQQDNSYAFHLLETSLYEKKTGVITFRVSEEFYKATEDFKQRFINTSTAMRLRENNDYAIELSTYLQLRGRGVDKATGEALPAKKVYHSDVIIYLHLASVDVEGRYLAVRRAFDALHKQGFPKYVFITIGTEEFWTYDVKADPAQRYMCGENFE